MRHIYYMTITQTIDIPAESRRITLDIPSEIPAGRVIVSFTPSRVAVPKKTPISRFFGILSPNTYGDGVTYQRELRDEWDG